MNNNIDDLKKVKNDSASLNDYEIEVSEKKGFFVSLVDRIKGGNSTKLLESGNKDTFQKTNRSISSMWTIGSLRRALMEKLETFNRSIFGAQENVDQSNITTHVIGRDDLKKDDLSQEATKTPFEPVIPVAKSVAARSNRIIPQPVKTGIINNSKSAEDVKEEVAETQGLTLEEVEISEEFTEEYEDDLNINNLTAGDIINNTSRNAIQFSSIEVAEINVQKDKPKEQKQERNDDDDRDL